MPFIYLLEGLIIGFSLAAPIGPVGILCVRHTLTFGNRHGYIVGLSGASADVIYATVAAFGITLISDFVTKEQHLIRLAGGILLLTLGFYTFRSNPSAKVALNRPIQHTRVFVSTFLLTLTNPLTMFGYASVISVVATGKTMDDHFGVAMLVFGVFLGSLLWFFLLTNLAHFFTEKITVGGIAIVNKVAGSLLMLLGATALWSSLRSF